MKKSFSAPGKIILSGEYAVVFGYPGIAVPSRQTLDVTYQQSSGDLQIQWDEQNHHPAWIQYIQRIVTLLKEQLDTHCGGTIMIKNHLPLGKGMGSSTALVVALTRALGSSAGIPEVKLRGIALKIEDDVNPGHSGIDFATIWSGKSILFQKGEPPVEAYLSLDFLKGAVLIDTGTPDQTTKELVAWMKSREAEVASILETIGACTKQFLEGENPRGVVRRHHKAQLALGVVPSPVADLIAALEAAGGSAKVIGAGSRSGGAGIVLALGVEKEKIATIAEDHNMHIIS